MTHYRYIRDRDLCQGCRYCVTRVSCPSPQQCIGCKACYLSCPNEALVPESWNTKQRVTISVDGNRVEVPAKVTIKAGLHHVRLVAAMLVRCLSRVNSDQVVILQSRRVRSSRHRCQMKPHHFVSSAGISLML
jgi:ferredoxin